MQKIYRAHERQYSHAGAEARVEQAPPALGHFQTVGRDDTPHLYSDGKDHCKVQGGDERGSDLSVPVESRVHSLRTESSTHVFLSLLLFFFVLVADLRLLGVVSPGIEAAGG